MALTKFLLSLAFAIASSSLQAAEDKPARDGAHDFDFARGEWHTHVTRVLDPFSGGTHTVTLDGTKTAHFIWNGRALLEEIEADGPDGHWERATLFTYNAKSGQWSQTYIDGDNGVQSPTIGGFKDGRGEFFGTSLYEGRQLLERGVWSNIKANSHRFEIFLSQDGGESWALRFGAILTRTRH